MLLNKRNMKEEDELRTGWRSVMSLSAGLWCQSPPPQQLMNVSLLLYITPEFPFPLTYCLRHIPLPIVYFPTKYTYRVIYSPFHIFPPPFLSSRPSSLYVFAIHLCFSLDRASHYSLHWFALWLKCYWLHNMLQWYWAQADLQKQAHERTPISKNTSSLLFLGFISPPTFKDLEMQLQPFFAFVYVDTASRYSSAYWLVVHWSRKTSQETPQLLFEDWLLWAGTSRRGEKTATLTEFFPGRKSSE